MNKFLLVGLFILLGLFIYVPSLRGAFILDDYTGIVDNVYIRTISDPATLYFYSPGRFITYLSFALNYQIAKLDTFSFHLTNVFIHILTSLLVFTIASQISGKKDVRYAVIASLIFLTHPLQTQAVSYITQRTASLTAMFYLLTIVLFVRSSLKFSLTYILALLSALTAFFTKEISYTLPLVLALVSVITFKNKPWRRIAGTVAPFFVILIMVFFNVAYTPRLASAVLAIKDPSHTNPLQSEYIYTQIRAVSTYFKLLVFPAGLTIDHDFPVKTTLFDQEVLISGLAIVIALWAAIVLAGRHNMVTFGVLFFFLTLSIEALVPLEDVLVEHRMYLPSVGAFLVYAYIVMSAFAQLNTKLPVIVIITHVIVLSFLTFSRNRVWESEFSLWSDAVAKAPQKARPHANLGVTYKIRGDTTKALEEYNKAIQLNPAHIKSYLNSAAIFINAKEPDKAFEIYQKGLEKNPHNETLLLELSKFYAANGKTEEAKKLVESELGQVSKKSILYFARGMLYLEDKNYQKAAELFLQAIQDDPVFVEAYAILADTNLLTGNLGDALVYYNRAFSLYPYHKGALINRGKLYLRQNSIQAAKKDLLRYTEIYEVTADVSYHLGVAYYLEKDFTQAKKYLQDALSQDPTHTEAQKLLKQIL